MNPTLYYDDRSPPVRSVLLLIKALDIKLDYQFVNLFKGAHLRPDFLKVSIRADLIHFISTNRSLLLFQLSPLHTVPVLKHGDLVLTDSHAILMYLCDLHAGDSPLAVKNSKQRAAILNRLMFNATVFFPRDSVVMVN